MKISYLLVYLFLFEWLNKAAVIHQILPELLKDRLNSSNQSWQICAMIVYMGKHQMNQGPMLSILDGQFFIIIPTSS